MLVLYLMVACLLCLLLGLFAVYCLCCNLAVLSSCDFGACLY